MKCCRWLCFLLALALLTVPCARAEQPEAVGELDALVSDEPMAREMVLFDEPISALLLRKMLKSHAQAWENGENRLRVEL